ncbi:MAG: sporulation protein, partial [Oscillospiraceae bacterium]|nr:sporulation protein [Oscillospiraceae bacterium]
AAFPAAVRDAFASAWSVCGFVVIFAVILRFVTLALPARPLLVGFLELTNGVLALRADRGGFVLCAVFLGWGGVSVHAQTLSVLDGTDLSPRLYLWGKMTQAALSAPLALMVANWLY